MPVFYHQQFKAVTCSFHQTLISSEKMRPSERRNNLITLQPLWPEQGQKEDCQDTAVSGNGQRQFANKSLMASSWYSAPTNLLQLLPVPAPRRTFSDGKDQHFQLTDFLILLNSLETMLISFHFPKRHWT